MAKPTLCKANPSALKSKEILKPLKRSQPSSAMFWQLSILYVSASAMEGLAQRNRFWEGDRGISHIGLLPKPSPCSARIWPSSSDPQAHRLRLTPGDFTHLVLPTQAVDAPQGQHPPCAWHCPKSWGQSSTERAEDSGQTAKGKTICNVNQSNNSQAFSSHTGLLSRMYYNNFIFCIIVGMTYRQTPLAFNENTCRLHSSHLNSLFLFLLSSQSHSWAGGSSLQNPMYYPGYHM